jgi:hypothetical protein
LARIPDAMLSISGDEHHAPLLHLVFNTVNADGPSSGSDTVELRVRVAVAFQVTAVGLTSCDTALRKYRSWSGRR